MLDSMICISILQDLIWCESRHCVFLDYFKTFWTCVGSCQIDKCVIVFFATFSPTLFSKMMYYNYSNSTIGSSRVMPKWCPVRVAPIWHIIYNIQYVEMLYMDMQYVMWNLVGRHTVYVPYVFTDVFLYLWCLTTQIKNTLTYSMPLNYV